MRHFSAVPQEIIWKSIMPGFSWGLFSRKSSLLISVHQASLPSCFSYLLRGDPGSVPPGKAMRILSLLSWCCPYYFGDLLEPASLSCCQWKPMQYLVVYSVFAYLLIEWCFSGKYCFLRKREIHISSLPQIPLRAQL